MRGLVRGSGVRGAVSNVKAVLTQARQYAITQEKRTYVIFGQAGEVSSMAVCTRYAACDAGGATYVITDDPLPWDTNSVSLVGGTVYNLENGKSGTISRHEKVQGSGVSYQVDRLDTIQNLGWAPGAGVGFEAAEQRFLPSGMAFSGGDPETVIFNADGTTAKGSGVYQVKLEELYVANPQSVTLEVNGLTGWVKVLP